MNYAELSAPFPAKEIEWRIQKKSNDQKKALVIAYINARTVMDRLDEVVGPENWTEHYRTGAQGGVICRLELRVGEEWVGKEDGAENTNVEAIKGGISDAFKRAGVKWGIGRYLYDLPATWVILKNTYGDFDPPRLPPWAIPGGDTTEARVQSSEEVNPETGELPPLQPPPPARTAAGVPEWWPQYRQLLIQKRVTDAAVEAVIGCGPTVATVEKWMEENDENFTQLVRRAEGEMATVIGGNRG